MLSPVELKCILCIFCQVEFHYALSFPNVSQPTVTLLTFYHVNTVSQFGLRFNLSYVGTSCRIFPIFVLFLSFFSQDVTLVLIR